jgi:hypothetical protein
MLEVGLRAYLLSHTTITNLVAQRVHYGRMLQNSNFPVVVFHIIHEYRVESMSGGSGLVRALVQIDHWAKDILQAAALAKATREVLQGYQGGVWGTSPNTVTVQGVHSIGGRRGFEPDVNEDRVIHEYHIWYEESIPSFS